MPTGAYTTKVVHLTARTTTESLTAKTETATEVVRTSIDRLDVFAPDAVLFVRLR